MAHTSYRTRSRYSTPRHAPGVEALEGRQLLASINEFGAGAGLVGPSDLALGPDGNLWFGEAGGRVGRIGAGGQIAEFTAGITGAPNITGIAAGSDGNLWFAENDTDRIGRITPQGVVTEFNLNSVSIPPFKQPLRITPESDGALWFTEQGADQIGRITTQGVVSEFFVTDAPLSLTGIVSGPDGNLWFAETARDTIGVMSTQGVLLNEYSAGITPGSGLNSIADGPDGALWFTETQGNAIGRITTAGAVTQFPIGLPGAGPNGIALAPDGNLYFAEAQGNAIGRISTAGVVVQFPVATSATLPLAVAVGSDRNLWFTEYGGSLIGQLVLPTSIIPAGTSLAVIPGQPTTATFATFSDFSPATIAGNFHATIDFGDGTTGPGTVQATGPGQFAVIGTHTYTQVGNYAATITVGTDAGDAAPVTSSVVARSSLTTTGTTLAATSNVPLTAAFATFTDLVTPTTASDYTATVDFGDGTAGPGTIRANGPGQFAVFATHTYLVNGNVSARVVVSDKYTNAPAATTPVLVSSGIATRGAFATVVAGRPSMTVFATFGDRDATAPAASYAATVAFGDGSTGPGTIQLIAPGQFAVYATHAYARQGNYTDSIVVGNAAGNAAPATASIAAVSGVLVFGTTLAATANQPLTADFATFGDVASTTTAADYTATIDFGDGTTGIGTVRKTGVNVFAVSATHTYTTSGSDTAIVNVFDQTGEANRATTAPSTTLVAVTDPLSTVVTNTNDTGRGSLRQAILNANILPGPNTISFQIPGPGVKTIRPLTQLPALTDQVVIDGATQAAFAGVATQTPLIEVDGGGLAGQATGLDFLAGSASSQVADLAIFGFHGAQIDLVTDSNAVVGSYVGLRADGTIPGIGGTLAAPDSSYEGVVVHGFGNRIGGLAAGQGNVISGNRGDGLDFKDDGSFGASGFHLVYGNLIGLDPTGTRARGNGYHGILIEGGVGSVVVGAGNVISGNGGNGVELVGASNTAIAGSFIGTDVSGTRAIGNAGAGVCIDLGSTFTQVGSLAGVVPTLISGNGFLGIAIRDGSSNNTVTNALIGTDVTGGAALGNGSSGILITEAPSNAIVLGNVISGNGSARDGAGVWIEGAGSTGNTIAGNKIGTDITGNRRLGNAVVGVLIVDAPNNLIGGPPPGGAFAQNLISGNGQVGVMISGAGATGNRVFGNLIGTDFAGTGAIPNGQIFDGARVGAGVYINGASGNMIGDGSSGSRNVISGNFADGVQVSSAGSTGNQVRGNFIGTDTNGYHPLGNGRDGVVILDAARDTIEGNVVSANRRDGIVLGGSTSAGNVVATNAIGLGASGKPIGNGAYGLLFTDGARTRANAVAADNRIAGNGSNVVRSTSDVPSAPPLVVQGHKAGAARKASKIKVQARAGSFGGRGLHHATRAKA